MSAAIGLAVASDELRAVLVRDGAVTWCARSGRTSDSLAAQVGALLAQVPRRRWRRVRVTGTVGPNGAQVKRLHGLPPLDDAAALALVVREGAGRLFLRNGIPLETSGVRIVERGTAWAAAFEQPLLREIDAGCRAAGLRLRAVVPVVIALAAALRDGVGRWDDGESCVEFTAAGGAVIAVRRSSRTGEHTADPPAIPSALEPLGADGWRYCDAFGASFVTESEPLAWRAEHGPGAAGSRRRTMAAAAACAFAATLAVAGPGLAAEFDHARAGRELAQLAPHARDAAAVADELRRISGALAEVAALADTRRSSTSLLAGLARSLPPGAALVTLRVDSAGGTLVLLAPHASRAIAALDSVPGIAAPEIVGPVTRETMGKSELERATVRFRLAQRAAR